MNFIGLMNLNICDSLAGNCCLGVPCVPCGKAVGYFSHLGGRYPYEHLIRQSNVRLVNNCVHWSTIFYSDIIVSPW